MVQITKDHCFHLQTKSTSYIMKVLPSGHLSNLYYGKSLGTRDNYDSLYQNYTVEIGSVTDYNEAYTPYSLESTRLELGTNGKGDYRNPSLFLESINGSRTSDFSYKTHRSYAGKKEIPGLPSTFQHDDQVNTLEIDLIDVTAQLLVTLHYSVFYDRDIITRRIRISNLGSDQVKLHKVMSMNLDLKDKLDNIMTLDGQWIRERHVHKRPLSEGQFLIESSRGVSSAQHNPFIALCNKDTSEHTGECYGFGLVYSGNHRCSVQLNHLALTRVQLGINDHDFEWVLDEKEVFDSPEVLMTYSNQGFNGMSQHFHDVINKNLIPNHWQGRERPILLNNWEATYFDFSEKKLMTLAKEAKKLGIELFVLDDGWFGKRNDDTSSLGDWYVNKKKLPNGLKSLSQSIHQLGLQFGLWFEPEMVNMESDLYRAHPDWAIKLPDRTPSLGRHQLLLDLAREEVVNYLFERISQIIDQTKLDYIKWDMNRSMSDHFSQGLAPSRQKEHMHRYMLGLYSLLDQLKSTYPHVLFESCASGGNRFDLAMLHYMPQTWTSDNTDANERIKIQYGTSMVYPVSTMGAHVSDSPSHQLLRHTPIETRFNVAAFGLLGYELDLSKLTAIDKKAIKRQISYYKKHRQLLQFGKFSRLQSPFDHNITQWMVGDEDQKSALVGYYQTLQKPQPTFEQIKLCGLIEDSIYHSESREQSHNVRAFGNLINEVSPVKIRANSTAHNMICNNYDFKCEREIGTYYGDELMFNGLPLYHQFTGTGYNDTTRHIGDFGSRLYFLEEVKKDEI